MTTEELIRTSSTGIAAALRASAKNAKKEAEVRIACEREIGQLAKQARIKLEGRHEFTVASGFVDSVYDKVIIEYKNPSSPSDRIGKDLQSAGSQKLVAQIKSRFYDLRTQEGRTLNSLLGVGIDGNRFIFARFREDQWDIQEPVEVNATSVRRFLTALFNLGTSGKALSASSLAQDFGGESHVAAAGIKKLYEALITSKDPKTTTLLGQWKMLFSEVSGYDEGSGKNKLADLATLYDIRPRGMKGPELLFALQTYYALLMKLLAAEVISYYQGLTSPVQKIVKSGDSRSLRGAVTDIENGGIFKHLNITNFLEGDLFSWYAWEWPAGIDEVVRTVAERLDGYNPGTLSEDPAGTKDLLKKLYHKLFPKSVRHALGEYYTPDWLAAHVAEESGYKGDPDQRVLDPSCGSGTFLVEAINRVKAYFDEHMESLPYDERGLADRILRNIVGFDLNPIAVLAARTNFLIAIREFVPRLDKVEIPVYLCDSVLTPSEYGDLFTGTDPVARVPCVAIKPPYLMVPKEIASSQSTVNTYTDALMHCVDMKFSVDDFMQHCANENMPLTETDSHRNLYSQLLLLKQQNRDGIWARIIRNAFAPLFAGTFDFVLGNPPWINWESLPDGYRRLTVETWEHYRLQGGRATGTRQSSSRSKTDMSILLTYVAADKYLREGGKLSFVITRSIFQSELGGQKFRQFRLPDGRFLDIQAVNDLDPVKPFRGQAANVTCTFSLGVGKQTTFPVPWNVWKQKGRSTVSEDDDIREVMQKVEILHWAAEPIDDHASDSSWLFADPLAFKVLRRLISPSAYSDFAREGINTRGANGVFFVDAWTRGEQTFVRNRPNDGRNAEVDTYEGAIEPDYLYPLLRGRDVSRWSASTSQFIVLPHSPDRPTYSPRLIDLPKKTRGFLSHFAEVLGARSSFRNFDPGGSDQYGLYSVLNATFAPYKVVWREMATGTIAAICTTSALPNGVEKTVIPDHKLFIIPCTSLDEATFVCGVFNSAIANYIIRSYSLATGISTHVLGRLGIPLYSDKNSKHKAVVAAANRCIKALASTSPNPDIEVRLDRAVGDVYGLSPTELETITKANGELSGIPIEGTEAEAGGEEEG